MIDLHCHFLPGIDDGPETVDEALALARAAVADGITHSMLTSHIDPDRYVNQRSSLEGVFASFAEQIRAARIPLELRLGGEARLCPELMDLIADNQAPFLGEVDGWRILLLEFPHHHPGRQQPFYLQPPQAQDPSADCPSRAQQGRHGPT